MNDSGNRGTGSERGSIEPRRRQGISNLLDFDPFRGFFPGNWQQMFGIDVNRKGDSYEIEMPVPGFKPEDIDITYQDGVITVAGRNERRSFTRMLTVPEDVDEDSIQANVENGIMTITMRQHPKAQPKKISIGTSAGTSQTSSSTSGTTTGTATSGSPTGTMQTARAGNSPSQRSG